MVEAIAISIVLVLVIIGIHVCAQYFDKGKLKHLGIFMACMFLIVVVIIFL
ncbi:MAG: hypothetical protein HFJ41_05235 [Clostridia bacterium]|nr:hypothetical protein [Clostridia bacterium]